MSLNEKIKQTGNVLTTYYPLSYWSSHNSIMEFYKLTTTTEFTVFSNNKIYIKKSKVIWKEIIWNEFTIWWLAGSAVHTVLINVCVCVCVKNGSGFVIISVIAVISIVKFIQLFRKQLCNRGDKRYMLTCIWNLLCFFL